jgi:CubicO group peptidase (beta-lactamase class C family)
VQRGAVGVRRGAVSLRRGAAHPASFVVQGSTAAGEPLSAATLVYTASLSKQFTAACAALLARDGLLDIDSALSRWLPELPAWARAIRLRHLVHHTAGLPADTGIDTRMASGHLDRTTHAIISTLCHFPHLPRRPGTGYEYSNAGYACLAAAMQRATGRPFPDLARQRLFGPLGMHDTLFWAGPQPTPPKGAPLSAVHPAPLSLGDGGVWSTANDLMRWNQAMNADTLGIATVLQTPGRLDDGTNLDYGWGIGIRTHRGYTVYRHGGGWPGLRLLLARIPALQAGLLIIAPADDTERRVALANTLLDEITSAN